MIRQLQKRFIRIAVISLTMALILVGIIIWIQRSHNKELQEKS